MPSSEFIQQLWKMGPIIAEQTPHGKELGIKFVAVDKGRATMSLPYNPDLIGDPETRVLHGGAVTTLLDQACGLAAIAGFDEPSACATLNLSIDYMRAAKPGETIIAQAHCYKATKHVAFLRAVAHDGDETDPIATAQATFMATGKRPKGAQRW
jgi:uncharacterized protein (TIGR00369 family)